MLSRIVCVSRGPTYYGNTSGNTHTRTHARSWTIVRLHIKQRAKFDVVTPRERKHNGYFTARGSLSTFVLCSGAFETDLRPTTTRLTAFAPYRDLRASRVARLQVTSNNN